MASTTKAIEQFSQIDVNSADLLAQEAARIAPGYEEQFKEGVKNIIDAMNIGHLVFMSQYSPESLKVYTELSYLKSRGVEGLDNYLRAIEINGSIFDSFTAERIKPDFTPKFLKDAYTKLSSLPSAPVPDEIIDILFSKEMFTSLPASRGIYPAEINTDAGGRLLQKIKNHPKAKKAYTRIAVTPTGDITTGKFSDVYRNYLGEMYDKINDGAVPIFMGIPGKKFLDYAGYIESEIGATYTLEGKYPYDSSDIALIKMCKENKMPFFSDFGFNTNYSDKFGLKSFLSGTFSLETEPCREIKDLVADLENFQLLEDSIPYVDARRKNVNNVPILMHDVLFRTGYSRAGSQGIAITYLSDNKKIVDKEGTVIAVWRNMLDAKSKLILSPIARTILPEEFISEYGESFDKILAMAFIVGITGHEQRHFIGAQLEREKLSERLGDNFTAINEGKAESGRLYGFNQLISKGFENFSRDEMLRFFQQTYLAEVIRHARFGMKISYGKSAMARLNYFVQKKAVTITDDLKMPVDHERLEQAVTDLYSLHLQILKEGDGEGAKEYFKEYEIRPGSKLDGQLNGILKNVTELGTPRDITINYKW